MLLEQLQRMLDLRRHILGRRQCIFWRGVLRFEIRVVARRCKHLMHFTQALAKHGREILQFAKRVVVLVLIGHGVRQLVAQRPFQVVLGPFPGIALIAQVALGDHQQVVFARRIPTHHRPQQRRDIAKPGAGQIRAHFQFRVHARGDFANQLEHQAVADHHRAVGLLGGQVAHFRLCRQAQFRQFSRRLETDLAAIGRQYPVFVHSLQHRADKVLQAEGIGDQTDLRPTAHP
ncbi:hypothetical protein D3C87_1294260 [compost metagenome]